MGFHKILRVKFRVLMGFWVFEKTQKTRLKTREENQKLNYETFSLLFSSLFPNFFGEKIHEPPFT